MSAKWSFFLIQLRDFVRSSKLALIFLFLAMLAGVAVGVVAGLSLVNAAESADLSEYALCWYYGTRVSFGTYFGKCILDGIMCVAILFLCNLTVVLVFGNHLLMFAKGYVIGFDILVIVGGVGVGGIYQIIFVFIPQQILLCLFLIYCSVCATKRCLMFRGCGALQFHGVEYDFLLRKWLFAFVFFCVINLLLSAIVTIISSNLII